MNNRYYSFKFECTMFYFFIATRTRTFLYLFIQSCSREPASRSKSDIIHVHLNHPLQLKHEYLVMSKIYTDFGDIK